MALNRSSILWRKFASNFGALEYQIFLTDANNGADLAKLSAMVESGAVKPMLDEREFEVRQPSPPLPCCPCASDFAVSDAHPPASPAHGVGGAGQRPAPLCRAPARSKQVPPCPHPPTCHHHTLFCHVSSPPSFCRS